MVCGMMQVDEAVRETPICAMPNGGDARARPHSSNDKFTFCPLFH